MELRKATMQDIPAIMEIIREAQSYFKENEINQWQNNYPNHSTIEKDIENAYSYVLVDNNNTILATVSISFDSDTNYEQIINGSWLTNEAYAVIHRLAVKNTVKGQGISSIVLREIENMCHKNNIPSIKVDTHEQNTSMQKLLQKNDFQYCGIIFVADQSPRVAFEKLISI
ncbi:GNAT family N-acetyltransferase [Bacillus sp. B1-b2]|uniref:GNAT family N-acetyltransferase n=1 Tax=Bacillus sp. B1-b2 TaxID=2653201 RepID=UPI00126178E1|nr:GNAT family N-acetyltransferase [Bacillus sp. B1-b2]KAB7666479.1 GNAT family N-acetyltransferase [Bacillus sp. B1-b2]